MPEVIDFNPGTRGFATIINGALPKTTRAIESRNQRLKDAEDQRRERLGANARDFLKATEYAPESALIEYDKQLSDMVVKDFYSQASTIYKGDRTPTTDELLGLAKTRSRIDNTKNKIKAHKESIDDIRKVLDEDKEGMFNREAIERELGVSMFDVDGKLKSVDDLDPTALRENLFSKAEHLNGEVVVSTFMDNIDENIESFMKASSDRHGDFRRMERIKSKMLVLDEDGDIDYDTSGRPILNVTPQSLNIAKKNPQMAILIADEKERNPELTDLDAFRNIVEPAALESREVVQSSISAISSNKATASDRKATRELEREDRLNNNLLKTVFDKDEDFLGSLVDHDKILGARFEGDNPLPGGANDPKTKLVVQVPEMTRDTTGKLVESGENTEKTIDLSNPFSAMLELANLRPDIYDPKAVSDFISRQREASDGLLESVFNPENVDL